MTSDETVDGCELQRRGRYRGPSHYRFACDAYLHQDPLFGVVPLAIAAIPWRVLSLSCQTNLRFLPLKPLPLFGVQVLRLYTTITFLRVPENANGILSA